MTKAKKVKGYISRILKFGRAWGGDKLTMTPAEIVDATIRLGRSHKQKSIYEVKKGEVIFL